jgi:drug/metabolite transporter (DMT)-like permease
MPVLLAFATALVYGVADYCGGRATRSATSVAVTLAGQSVSLVGLLVLVPLLGDPVPAGGDWAWGAGAGLAGVLALVCFYHALSAGAMTVVAPVTAVVSVVVPVIVGLAQGERPGVSAYVGAAVAVAGVALVSGAFGGHDRVTPAPIVALAALAGVGFGLVFVFLAHTGDDAGLWPLLAARLVSVPAVLLLALLTRRSLALPSPAPAPAFASGLLDMTANALYLAAARSGLLTIVAVVASLYPASTVVLATTIDRERLARPQVVGLGLCLVALVLVTLGR